MLNWETAPTAPFLSSDTAVVVMSNYLGMATAVIYREPNSNANFDLTCMGSDATLESFDLIPGADGQDSGAPTPNNQIFHVVSRSS